MRFVLNWIITSIAIALATYVVPGITPFGTTQTLLSFACVGLFLGAVNNYVKPFISLISLPVTFLTLGAFQLVVNSFMLELAGWLSVSLFGMGIAIEGFGAALLGSIIISLLCSVLSAIFDVTTAW